MCDSLAGQNYTNEELEDCRFEEFVKFISQTNQVTIIIWPIIALIGILANACVLLVIILSSKINTAQYYIFSLSTSDLIFLLICPANAILSSNLKSLNSITEFQGLVICKLSYALSHTSTFITCMTLMAMTLDRYVAIMHPFETLTSRTKKTAVLINVFIWILSIGLSFPHGYHRIYNRYDDGNESDENSGGFCNNSFESKNITIGLVNLNQFTSIYTALFAYIIPLICIVGCYSVMMRRLSDERKFHHNLSESQRRNQSKKLKRILLMIALVTLLFAFSWFPIHVIYFLLQFWSGFPHSNKSLYALKTVAHTLTYANSALNPFFYTIMSNNFQKKLLFCKNAQARRYSAQQYSNHHYTNGLETTSLTQNRRVSNPRISTTKTTRL